MELLGARTPKLRQAVRDAAKARYAYVVVDRTVILIDRVAADRPFYSGKHRKHGMNLHVIASPGDDILWVSGAPPRPASDPLNRGSGLTEAMMMEFPGHSSHTTDALD